MVAMALRDMAVSKVCRVKEEMKIESTLETNQHKRNYRQFQHHWTNIQNMQINRLTEQQQRRTIKKAIPTPAIPTIQERRRNNMTPRIFCTVGR